MAGQQSHIELVHTARNRVQGALAGGQDDDFPADAELELLTEDEWCVCGPRSWKTGSHR